MKTPKRITICTLCGFKFIGWFTVCAQIKHIVVWHPELRFTNFSFKETIFKSYIYKENEDE
jgi:hypothetical protein